MRTSYRVAVEIMCMSCARFGYRARKSCLARSAFTLQSEREPPT